MEKLKDFLRNKTPTQVLMCHLRLLKFSYRRYSIITELLIHSKVKDHIVFILSQFWGNTSELKRIKWHGGQLQVCLLHVTLATFAASYQLASTP